MKKILLCLLVTMPMGAWAQGNSPRIECSIRIVNGKNVVGCQKGNLPAVANRPDNTTPNQGRSGQGQGQGNQGQGNSANTPAGAGEIYTPTAMTTVQQQETIQNFLLDARKIVHPQTGYSASIAFSTTTKQSGYFATTANTSYRIPEYVIANISNIPGDFIQRFPHCYQESPTENIGIPFYNNTIAVSRNDYCMLSPGTYYFNIKFAYPDGRPGCGGNRDNCGLFVDVM